MSTPAETGKSGYAMPGGSLVFDYTDAEIETIRQRTMLERHAEQLVARRKGFVRGFLKWSAIGFAVLCVIMVMISVLDDSFDNSGWYVLPLGLGFIVLMAAMMAPALWFRFSRPAKTRKLALISTGQADIRVANKKAAIIRFGGITNARQWRFPPNQVDMIINGEFYDVYYAGDLLVYVELAHLEPDPA